MVCKIRLIPFSQALAHGTGSKCSHLWRYSHLIKAEAEAPLGKVCDLSVDAEEDARFQTRRNLLLLDHVSAVPAIVAFV